MTTRSLPRDPSGPCGRPSFRGARARCAVHFAVSERIISTQFPDAPGHQVMSDDEAFLAGTTSIQAADAEGWVVSITPSGGWIPPFIAGKTGIGLSQRMQSFVLSDALNPFNVVSPGKRPRATLTPGMALKNGKPYLSFAVQGGDSQDQNLLQFFLNMVEFGMDVQSAVEAPTTAIFFDEKQGGFQGAASYFGEDYGIAW